MSDPWPKGIFFDFAGVLVQSEPAQYSVWQQVVRSHGLSAEDLPRQTVVGRSDSSIAMAVSLALHHAVSSQELIAEKQALWRKLDWDQRLTVPAGRDQFLRWVRPKLQCLAIVSSGGGREITAILRRQGVLDLFDWIIDGRSVARHKPDPEPYLRALERSQLKSTEVLAIEDSVHGVTAAVGAGLEVWQLLLEGTEDLCHATPQHLRSYIELEASLTRRLSS